MKLPDTIHVGDGGVLYYGEDVFTSAPPLAALRGPASRAENNEQEDVKSAVLLSFTKTWVEIAAAIELLPAHSLSLMLRSMEPFARLYENKSAQDKSILIVLLTAHIQRTVDSHWRDVITLLVVRLIRSPSSIDDIISGVISHYTAAELASDTRLKSNSVMRDL